MMTKQATDFRTIAWDIVDKSEKSPFVTPEIMANWIENALSRAYQDGIAEGYETMEKEFMAFYQRKEME